MMKQSTTNILMVGPDLTSNGGIASAVKSYYKANNISNSSFCIFLLKTGYYEDKGLIFEISLFFTALIKLPFIILKKNIGIVHFHTSSHISYYRTVILFLVAHILKRKTIIHFHASDFREFFIERNRLQFLNKYVFNKADYLIVLCTEWRDILQSKYKLSKVLYIPNPIELNTNIFENFYARLKSTNNQILFIGFLIQSKGIKDIIDLAKLFKAQRSKIKIVIAGKGPLHDYILSEIQKNDLTENLELFGWADENAKGQLFINSDIFILPSYKEGMPISILEAMSFGLPIISTKIAGIPEEVKQNVNGFLYEPGDINGYYEGITAILNNRNLRYSMGQNSLLLVKSFDSKSVLDRLYQVYSNLVGNPL